MKVRALSGDPHQKGNSAALQERFLEEARSAGHEMPRIDAIIQESTAYIQAMPKDRRKQYGQFFTGRQCAAFMAEMFSIPEDKSRIRVLDPGAGSGILGAAVVARLLALPRIAHIELTFWENDPHILPLLKQNMEFLHRHAEGRLVCRLVEENYITRQNGLFGTPEEGYDLVICNPPYKKIGKDALEAKMMPHICHGAPNLYFLFAAMSLANLREGGELVYIMPHSWTSGAYFKKFRQYFLSEGKLKHIHIFADRNNLFDSDTILQETMIVHAIKSKETRKTVTITSSENAHDFSHPSCLETDYETVVSGKEKYVFLATDEREISALKRLRSFTNTLPDLGLRMKTGLAVDFRCREMLREKNEEGAVPLFCPWHIQNGRITFPVGKKQEYICTTRSGLLQSNRNYLFVKRFTSKEENRRLQCGIYLAKNFVQYQYISTENKVNFIDSDTNEGMSDALAHGLYVLFNSTVYDTYYRILNGSTQVNSTEINAMPVPALPLITQMGEMLMKRQSFSAETCDWLFKRYCHEHQH